MFTTQSKWLASLCCAGLMFTMAHAQDSGPLIDLLVRKGIIDDQEAEDLRSELVKEFTANSSAGKLNVSSSITELKFSGDVRLRHQEETKQTQNTSTTDERRRERIRFRFNGDMLLRNGWGAGFALETANAADSGNQTLQDANADYGLYLARAYVSWQPNRNWFFTGGKFKNPFYTSDLVWDSDINPQGFAEVYTSYIGAKDTLDVRAGQIIMDDHDEKNIGPAGRDAWLFSQQAVYTHWFGHDEIGNPINSVVLAPGFMVYNQSTLDGLASPDLNETPFNGSTRGLAIATFAGEVNFGNFRGRQGATLKAYWDSTYNFSAAERVHDVYALPSTTSKDAFAWLVGLGYGYGAGKVQGDYSLKVEYRQSPIGAIDPNLNDSDFGFGNLNQKGWKLAAAYNLTDFASVNATYFYTTDIHDALLQSLVAKLDHSQVLQVDLVVKF